LSPQPNPAVRADATRLLRKLLQPIWSLNCSPSAFRYRLQIMRILPLPRLLVRDFPQTHRQRLRPRQHERTPQSEHAFACPHFAQPRLASRQHHKLRRQQIQPRNVLGGQQSIFSLRRQAPAFEPGLESGQNHPRTQQRVFHPRPRHPSRHLAKTISGLPSEQAETAQFPVRIAPLIGQKETVRRQMQNARRAASLDAGKAPCLSPSRRMWALAIRFWVVACHAIFSLRLG